MGTEDYMLFKQVTAVGVTACAALMLTTAVQASDLGRRYLAVDESLHGAGTNLNFVLGQATGNQEILRIDQNWELTNDLFLAGIQVFKGPDNVYRMYYGLRQVQPGGGTADRLALATSTDGINWTRHTTGNQFAGSNILNVTGAGTFVSGQGVFWDPNDNNYKMLWTSGSNFNMAYSNDGLSFVTTQTNSFTYKADTQHSVFWDSMKDQYVIYGRIRGSGTLATGGFPSGDTDRRGIPLHQSPTWSTTWTDIGNLVADPADIWTYTTHPNSIDNYPHGAGPDLYQPGVHEYHGQYIGLPAVFHRDPSRVPHNRPERVTGQLYPMLMHSLDGVNFNFPDLAHPIIDLTDHLRVNQWEYATNQTDLEVGQMYAGGMVEVGDQLYIYYSYRDDTHYEAGNDSFPNPHFDQQQDRSFNVAFLRRDGFASFKSDGPEGQWNTGNVVVPVEARGLLVNADVAGSLKVEVLDTGGTPIANLSLSDSIAFQGDETEVLMKWDAGQFQQVAGQTVQLRFVVEDGEIYSFAFTAIPEPASLALLGFGGAMLLRRRRWRAA